jgi:hypothetical protein
VAFQFDVLEQEAFEILRLIRLWRNGVAPVNRMPPEILALVPDFWNKDCGGRDRDLIALTHVCRTWREVFISRSSLWIDLDCEDRDKTHVYLERSKPLPVNLSLRIHAFPPPCHPFFKVVPHSIGRLKSLSIKGDLGFLEGIADHLSHPAPVLEELSIRGNYDDGPRHNPVLTPALFNGDLSSLRKMKLDSVRTELLWRNMVNLTSVMLAHVSWGDDSVKQLLDFFESAPHLREVVLLGTPTSGGQSGRLVPLACLEMMKITGGGSASPLLDSVLTPVGADLKIEVDLPNPPNKDHPPRFLDNLRNLANLTNIHLHIDEHIDGHLRMWVRFSGPNGQVEMISTSSWFGDTGFVLESLDLFDTSKVEQLRIDFYDFLSGDLPYRVLLPMKHLRTLTLYCCDSPHLFIYALHPAMSSSGTVICPNLEKLDIVLDGETFEMTSVIGVAAARASRGTKLKSARIIGRNQPGRADVLELEKHVSYVKCKSGVYAAADDDDGDDIDEEG